MNIVTLYTHWEPRKEKYAETNTHKPRWTDGSFLEMTVEYNIAHGLLCDISMATTMSDLQTCALCG